MLDQDGIVARKYAASVIPQTVIIDRQGDVVRFFVGRGPDLADQLREALKAVLQPPTVNAEPADAAPPGDDLNLDMTLSSLHDCHP
ncbi:MAG: hypothetical protein U0872_15560 [Planctomycetaceae bacterium]